MLRELSFSDVSWSLSVSMYICVSGIFCVTECNESSDINNNKHATAASCRELHTAKKVKMYVPPRESHVIRITPHVRRCAGTYTLQ